MKPKLLNAIATSRWYDPTTDTTYLSPDILPECQARYLTGFDTPFVLMLEEHRCWDWARVDPSLFATPKFLINLCKSFGRQFYRELRAEQNPKAVILDWEACRFNQLGGCRLGEAMLYLREGLSRLKAYSPRTEVVFYDYPFQDHPNGDESYLKDTMCEILPLVDGIGCLLYLRKPTALDELHKFLAQHIERCRRWGGGKPIWAIISYTYVEEWDHPQPVSGAEMDVVLDVCKTYGIERVCLWGSIKKTADFRTMQNLTIDARQRVEKIWGAVAGT